MNSPGIYVFSSAAIPTDRWTAFEKQSVEKLPLDREGYIDKKMKKHSASKKYWNAAGDFLCTVELHLSELVRGANRSYDWSSLTFPATYNFSFA